MILFALAGLSSSQWRLCPMCRSTQTRGVLSTPPHCSRAYGGNGPRKITTEQWKRISGYRGRIKKDQIQQTNDVEIQN